MIIEKQIALPKHKFTQKARFLNLIVLNYHAIKNVLKEK